MVTNYLIIGCASLAITYLVIPVLIKLSHRFQLLDKPQGRKRHLRPVPFTGGWAVFLCFWLGFIAALELLPDLKFTLGSYLPGIFAAHLVIFIGGLLDDLFDFSALVKLLFQSVAGLILILSGLKIATIYIPFSGAFLLGDLAYPVTIIWVLLIVNAINIVDGLDGLAAGLSVITAAGLLYTSIMLGVPIVALWSILLIGVLLAFLRFNFRNAQIFLGDSGAQTIGFIFALAAIYCPIKSYTVVAMLVPLLSLGVPLLELLLSFSRRLATGRSVVSADLGHLFHVLLRRGVGNQKTVLIFYAVGLTLQIFIFTLFLFDRRIVFSILVLFMLVVVGWFLRLMKQKDRIR